MKKVIMVLVDGMRPDSLAMCGNPFVEKLLAKSICTLSGTTVMPSVTLPCHMSLFHSVAPERHGILTNTYVPQVRPVKGLCETLRAGGKKCAMFYNWDELRDLSRPEGLAYSCFISGHVYSYKEANHRVTDECIRYIASDRPDFAFLYLGLTDAMGHDYGWMGKEYLESVNSSFSEIERLISTLDDEYVVIVTADHGGHGRSHGSDIPEDMTIPVIFYNKTLKESVNAGEVNIIDIAPTITALLGVAPDAEWEGKVPLSVSKEFID